MSIITYLILVDTSFNQSNIELSWEMIGGADYWERGQLTINIQNIIERLATHLSSHCNDNVEHYKKEW